jgi:transposase-like protein
MNSEILELKLAIEKWRSAPTLRRKGFPIEIKKRAVELLPRHSPKKLSRELGLCISMFYAWRNSLNNKDHDLAVPLSKERLSTLVNATKYHIEKAPVKKNEVVARIGLQNAFIEIHSTASLVAVCEKLMGRYP